MLFVLILVHIENVFFCFLYFDVYGHGKLDLKFVHCKAEKCVGSNKENDRTKSFGEKMFVYLRTHLLR